MTIQTPPSQTVRATISFATTGLVGTIGFRILQGTSVIAARTTAGITEDIAGSGIYTAVFTAPATAGTYQLIWDDGSTAPTHTAVEDLVVTYTAASTASPSGTDLCAVADVRTLLETRSGDTKRDGLMQVLISYASQVIMGEVEREFATSTSGTTSRTFEFDWQERDRRGAVVVNLAPYDLQSSSPTVTLNPEASSPVSLTVNTDVTVLPVPAPDGVYTSLRLSRYLANISQLYLRFGYAQIAVSGLWGFPTVPVDVSKICAETVASWMRRDVSQLGIQLGEMENLPPDVFVSLDLPLSARRKLNRYRRTVGAF